MRWNRYCSDSVAQLLVYIMNYIDSTLLVSNRKSITFVYQLCICNAESLAGSSKICLIYFWRDNFRIQFRIQCGIHYNALHFKGVIIYRRSHNLPTNNDFPSHYLPENFDWEVIINRYTGLFPLKFAILLLWKSLLVYALSQSVRTKPIRYLKSRWNVTWPRTSSNFCYDVFRGTFGLKIHTNLKEPFLWRSVTTLVSH